MPDPGLPSRLIQVVGRFRPDADGVGEAAFNLAQYFWREFAIRTDFVVYKPAGPDPELPVPDDFPHSVSRLNGSASEFDAILGRLAVSTPPTLLLHYVSYGFSGQGTPFWLPLAVNRFVRSGRVLTLFHELYARPRFATKTMFTSGLQKRIFRRLLAASEAAFTSSEEYLEIIRRNNPEGRPVQLVGICSNVGEPENPLPLARRTRRLAVFGRYPTRKILYSRHLATLARVARHLGVDEIADIGAVEEPRWMEDNVLSPLGTLARSYGTLPTEETSRLLSDSLVGAIAYRNELRGKSGIFAAYQAHAMAILLFPDSDVTKPRAPETWPVSAEELLAQPEGSDALATRLQETATAAHEHYTCYRSVRAMAETILPALRITGAIP